MYPEAGGSSSFARRAFNEFWSFFAAWAQMLNYTITIAISAFFVPHYIGGLFWEPLRHSPGDIIVGIVVDRGARARSTSSASRSRPASTSLLAVIDFCTQLLLVIVGGVLVLSPADADRQRAAAASRRRGRTSSSRSRSAMIAYTGIETISNMAEEAKDEAKTIPAAINRVRDRRVRDLLHAAGGRAVARCRSRRTPTASTRRCWACPRSRAATPATRCSAWSSTIDLGALPARRRRSTSACSPRRSCSSRPTRASSASRGSSTRWASTARCPTGCAGCTRSTARRGSGSSSFGAIALPRRCSRARRRSWATCTRSARCCRSRSRTSSVIRLRLTQPDVTRPYRGPGNVDDRRRRRCRCSRSSAGSARRSRSSSSSLLHSASRSSASAGWWSACVVYVLFRRRQGLDLTDDHKVAIPQPVVEHEAEYDSVLVALDAGGYAERCVATAAQARRAQAPRDPRARRWSPSRRAADRRARCPSQEAAAQSLIEQAEVQGGRRVSGHVEKVRAGQAGRRIVEEARATCARRRS